MSDKTRPSLFAASDRRLSRKRRSGTAQPAPSTVQAAFDPVRLTQARNLACRTKKWLASQLDVTPAAVSQYEMGTSRPRPELLPRMAEVLDVPLAFFLSGRPQARLDASGAHFRSLRSTRSFQRSKAVALTEQAWELTYALEKRVQFPPVTLPGFAGGEIHPGTDLPREPAAAARALRLAWELGTDPITHLTRRLEAHGIVVLTPPERDEDLRSVDAFSTSRLPRPIIVVTPNRSNDVYRHRYSAAHELGHLVLHDDATPGDVAQEHEANAFAAEFLTPRESILPDLPARADFHKLSQLRSTWGVSVKSLLRRCRELGLLSDSAASRAYQRLYQLEQQPGFGPEPLTGYPGEKPALLIQAFDLACERGLTITELARELAWNVSHVRQMLGMEEQRPVLGLIRSNPQVAPVRGDADEIEQA